ncbi:MAG: dihydrofolate reductase [Candidatus Jorgensenbacteria bacterium]
MIIIIVAVSKDGFIGKNGQIPWRLKSDMAHFKAVTSGHTVVMGRKTWESLPPNLRPLPERRNIVITRQTGFSAEGAEIVPSLEEAFRLAEEDEIKNNKNIFICGGAEIYKQALPYAEKVLITRVQKVIGDGDAKFPDLPPAEWNLISKKPGERSEGDECDFNFEIYSPNLRYIEFAAVRTGTQLKTMRTIRKEGHCPFCPENLSLYHKEPITWEGKHWVVTDSQWPYPGKNVHKLIILKKHAEDMSELPTGAGDELVAITAMVEKETDVKGGGIGFRFGDPILSGASVKHLHFQIISPKRGEEPVKFFIGSGS